RAVQKEEIQGGWLGVEALADGVIVVLAARTEFIAFCNKKGLCFGWGEAAVLDFLIEPDDVDVRVRQERLLWLNVQSNDTGTAKGLDPAVGRLSLGNSADLTCQLGLDALAFEGRYEWWQAHSLSSSAAPASSSASRAISFS